VSANQGSNFSGFGLIDRMREVMPRTNNRPDRGKRNPAEKTPKDQQARTEKNLSLAVILRRGLGDDCGGK